MSAAENKAVLTSFVEEVINQGPLERADDLVAINFVEPGSSRDARVLIQVISSFRTCLFRRARRESRLVRQSS